MDKLTAAKVFVDVAMSRSFTKTAERLNMSRPMVTRHVEAVEDWLNVRLLHRTTRNVSLTSAGEACLQDIERWLLQAEHITNLANTRGELSGLIRVAASVSFGYSSLLPAIKTFLEQHPKVSIDIDLEDSASDLIEKSIDLAVRISAAPDPSLIGKPIAVCDSVLVAAPHYLENVAATLGEIQIPSDLEHHECLGYKNFDRHVWHLTNQDEFAAVNITCRFSANETTTLLHAALQGMGVAVQPAYLANPYIQQGRLVRVLPEWQPKDLSIYVLYSSRKHLSPSVRALIDHLQQYFVTHQW